jgi:hypothetical protein
MENVALNFLSDDTILDADIDEMFSVLAPIAPPADMVARIMNTVSKLPQHEKPMETPWGMFNQLMVLDDPTHLC